jgi:hypothetical protein
MNDILNNNNLKIEAQKQLVGIKILICINIAVSAIYCLLCIISFFSAFLNFISAGFFQHYFDFKNYESDLISSFWAIIIFGGILTFFIMTLIGLNKGYRYSIITTRIILVLWCFSLLGLLLILLIFWKRLNLPAVQQYLHYGYGKIQILK